MTAVSASADRAGPTSGAAGVPSARRADRRYGSVVARGRSDSNRGVGSSRCRPPAAGKATRCGRSPGSNPRRRRCCCGRDINGGRRARGHGHGVTGIQPLPQLTGAENALRAAGPRRPAAEETPAGELWSGGVADAPPAKRTKLSGASSSAWRGPRLAVAPKVLLPRALSASSPGAGAAAGGDRRSSSSSDHDGSGRTTRRRRCRSPTGWVCCATGGWSRWTYPDEL